MTVSVLLRNAPRTGKPFTAQVIVKDWTPVNRDSFVVIGLKATAGAPGTLNDFTDEDYYSQALVQGLDRLSLTGPQGGPYYALMSIKGLTFTHAPGANVKIYAGLLTGLTGDADPLEAISPGVLLAA